ncbi:MAG: metallophosphoesterase [Myxococcota bacterium]
MEPLERVDELFVVSDLHLGGPAGRQIFNQERELAGLIDHVAARPAGRTAALVLNGDIVDFLAEEGADYLVAQRAVPMLEGIARAFPAVFKALAALTRTPDRRLVLVIGNHDVELGLGHVQRWLIQTLCGDDPAARGRLSFHMDDSGYSCRIGPARALCVHGNGVDEWNVVDHEALRIARLHLERGQALDPWEPNAGTKLVIDVLNGLKRDYPWVDLLKPETQLVPRLLVALDPAQMAKLRLFLPAFLRTFGGQGQRVDYLGAGAISGGAAGVSDEALLASILAPDAHAAGDAEALLAAADSDYSAGLDAVELARGEGGATTLGFGEYLWDRMSGVSRAEALRKALLDWRGDDSTFALDTRDSTFERLNRAVGGGVHFLIAGHTHLARALKRSYGYYYNSGTWIRLIELSKEILRDEKSFAGAYEKLTKKGGMLADLDAPSGKHALVTNRPTVVRICHVGDLAHGDLCAVAMAGGKLTLTPLEGSHFESEGG